MGTGSSGKSTSGKRGGNAKKPPEWTTRNELTAQDGSKIDLSDNPLKYGQKDAALTGKAREALEAFENRRYNNKIEFSRFVDADGNVIEDNKGGRGSVSASYSARMTADAMSHNHPRSGNGIGLLGGTFSQADLRNFGQFNQTTYRATALEGTYSISKRTGFNAEGLNQYYQAEVQRIEKAEHAVMRPYERAYDSAYKAYRKGEGTFEKAQKAYNTYHSEYQKSFNRSLVAFHEALIAGQEKYGYTYTLEGRN